MVAKWDFGVSRVCCVLITGLSIASIAEAQTTGVPPTRIIPKARRNFRQPAARRPRLRAACRRAIFLLLVIH